MLTVHEKDVTDSIELSGREALPSPMPSSADKHSVGAITSPAAAVTTST